MLTAIIPQSLYDRLEALALNGVMFGSPRPVAGGVAINVPPSLYGRVCNKAPDGTFVTGLELVVAWAEQQRRKSP